MPDVEYAIGLAGESNLSENQAAPRPFWLAK